LRRVCGILICDRGVLDFMVWVVVTLDRPGFLLSVYGRFLLRVALTERPVYLYADVDTLVRRADVPRGFILRELVVYSVLAKYLAMCSIDTSRLKPLEVTLNVLGCLGKR